MTPRHIIRRRSIKRLRERLVEQFGGHCITCGCESDLEFAHVSPTEIVGRGRGSYERIADVRDHPGSYLLLCKPCHIKFDREGVA